MRIPIMLRKIIIKQMIKGKKQEIYCFNIPFSVVKYGLGQNVMLGKNVTFIDYDVTIGDYTYINSGWLYQNVKIGKFCSIGHNVCIGPGEHYLDRLSTYPIINRVIGKTEPLEFKNAKDTNIGNDVWIGHGAVILNGIQVGSGAVIAAGAVVTKDVPPYAIVVGIPANVIKYRFDQSVIEELLKSEWWNKPREWFVGKEKALLHGLNKNNITELL